MHLKFKIESKLKTLKNALKLKLLINKYRRICFESKTFNSAAND